MYQPRHTDELSMTDWKRYLKLTAPFIMDFVEKLPVVKFVAKLPVVALVAKLPVV